MQIQIDEDKEARKMEAARAVLAGRSFTEGEEDPFEGLGPQEIQAYIDKALQGVSNADPFEVSQCQEHSVPSVWLQSMHDTVSNTECCYFVTLTQTECDWAVMKASSCCLESDVL